MKLTPFNPLVRRVTGIITTKIAGDKFGSVTLNEELTIPEITTPIPVTNYGKLYPKADNNLYFQDGAGVEHEIGVIEGFIGEASIYNNAVATVIETADTPIAVRQIVTGCLDGWTFDAGSTGAITVYADGGGGQVTVTSGSHGLSNGDIITIRGSTHYNGIFEIASVTTDSFKITATWDSDDGASDWDQGASLKAGSQADGDYFVTWVMSTAPAAACELIWKVNINDTPQNKSTAERKYPVNDIRGAMSSCIIQVVEGDVIWLSVQSDSTSDITNKHGNLNLHRFP